MRTAIRFLYATAIALFLSLAIGFGTLTFYPGPERPEYPIAIERKAPPAPNATPDPQETETLRKFDEDNKQFAKDEKVHHRNVLLLVTALSALALIVGVVAAGALDVLRAGVMLGALFSVIWALMYGANSAGKGAVFVAALVVLVLLAALSTDRVRAWLGRTLRLGAGEDLLR